MQNSGPVTDAAEVPRGSGTTYEAAERRELGVRGLPAFCVMQSSYVASLVLSLPSVVECKCINVQESD